MADLKSDKDVWMNKLRQTKEYKIDPVQKVLAQQIEELEEHDKPEEIEKIQKAYKLNDQKQLENVYGKWANTVNNSEEMQENRKMNPSKYTENDIEQAKCSIVEKITKHFDDLMFEMVCEEMSKNYLFQSQNYLTEAGYDLFEDEWFEFYHTHHGDILYQLRQTVFE